MTNNMVHKEASRYTIKYIGRLSYGFIGENADPELALTLHVTGNGDTGSLDLTAGNPFSLQRLDAERTESKLVTALGVALSTAPSGLCGILFFSVVTFLLMLVEFENNLKTS